MDTRTNKFTPHLEACLVFHSALSSRANAIHISVLGNCPVQAHCNRVVDFPVLLHEICRNVFKPVDGGGRPPDVPLKREMLSHVEAVTWTVCVGTGAWIARLPSGGGMRSSPITPSPRRGPGAVSSSAAINAIWSGPLVSDRSGSGWVRKTGIEIFLFETLETQPTSR